MAYKPGSGAMSRVCGGISFSVVFWCQVHKGDQGIEVGMSISEEIGRKSSKDLHILDLICFGSIIACLQMQLSE